MRFLFGYPSPCEATRVRGERTFYRCRRSENLHAKGLNGLVGAAYRGKRWKQGNKFKLPAYGCERSFLVS